jgi:hypothetical protein
LPERPPAGNPDDAQYRKQVERINCGLEKVENLSEALSAAQRLASEKLVSKKGCISDKNSYPLDKEHDRATRDGAFLIRL